MSETAICSQTPTNGTAACYLSFGRAMGYMAIYGGWVDVQGAGAQRSDPKTGDPANYPMVLDHKAMLFVFIIMSVWYEV